MRDPLLNDLRTVGLEEVLFAEVDVLHNSQQSAEFSFVNLRCWLVAPKHELHILFYQILQRLLKLQGEWAVIWLQVAVRYQQSVDVLKPSDNAVDGGTVLWLSNQYELEEVDEVDVVLKSP